MSRILVGEDYAMRLKVRSAGAPDVRSSDPLYKRVPTHDEHGKPLSDFMMLIPGLREWSVDLMTDRVTGMQAVLGTYQQVVFADLNVPLNVLWVSFRPEFGLVRQIVVDLQQRVPEAKLVAAEQG